MPVDWARIHTLLAQERLRRRLSVPEPPVPLILAGAAFSSASAIRQRWTDLLDWATAHGLLGLLIEHLPPAPDVDVAESIAGISEDGRGCWPEYGEQSHQKKKRPSDATVAATLKQLQANWADVAGAELATCTRPLRFSGHKRRRLVVMANPNSKPPWGSWYSTSRNPRAFTKFRKEINALIAPMEVDQVDFNLDKWGQDAI